MSGGRERLQLSVSTRVGRDTDVQVIAMPERDRVSVWLDGDGGYLSVSVDRDGIALLESALSRARAELDSAQDEMAATVAATTTTATTSAEGDDKVGTGPEIRERMSA